MNPSERDYILFLEDIVNSMKRVHEYMEGLDFKKFKLDYKTVDAVVRNFEIIGEAAKNLPSELKSKHTQIPWEEMYRLRNKVIHEYFGLDYEIIWMIATEELPINYTDISLILEAELKKRN